MAPLIQPQSMPAGMWTKSEQTDEHTDDAADTTDEHAEIRDEIETASRLSSWPCLKNRPCRWIAATNRHPVSMREVLFF